VSVKVVQVHHYKAARAAGVKFLIQVLSKFTKERSCLME